MIGPARLTVAQIGLAAAAALAGVVVVALRPSAGLLAYWLVPILIAGVNVTLAAIVARRAPDNCCGPLMAFSGLALVATNAVDVYFEAAGADPTLPLNPYLIAFYQGAWMVYYVPLALLMLFFPSGRLLSPRWRWVATGLVLVPVVFAVAAGLAPAPYAEPFAERPRVFPGWAVAGVIAYGVLPIFLLLLVASAASLFLRYRRATPAERLQLRWMAVAAMTIPLTLLLCWASYLALGTADLVLIGLAAMYVAVPVATTIALVRSTWFDVDELLVRTTVYAVLVGVVLAAVAVVSGLAGVLAARESVVVAVSVTVLTLIILLPLRRRLNAAMAALVFPHLERTLRAVSELQRDVHAGVRAPEELEATLREALDDPGLRVGYRIPGQTAFVDADGNPVERSGTVDPATTISIELAGDRIGLVVGTVRPPGWTAELSDVVALLAEIVRLRLETAQALQQVEASRRRLMQAQNEERQRLERDLHDGAQQRLVTLGMELRFAQRHLGPEAAEIGRLLDSSVTELQSAVAELRQIAHGLRPSSLDDGLPAALAHLRARAGVPIDLQVDVGEVPEEVSVTAYFVANEAVTNAVKYAVGQRIALSVAQAPGSLTVRVQDDGRGGAVLRNGSGLAGLRERVRALGGDLTVVSPVDRGTLVEAVLPCAS
jgi:signal transduction histidine kinase